MFDEDHASRALGIELVDNGEGHATARMRITAEMVNGHGNAHGGYIFLLADTAFACACNDSHETSTVASGADITYVRPARRDDDLVARAHERTRFGRSGIFDVSVTRGDEVIAEFRGHSRTLRVEGVKP
ncbi:hydroxyphenylacetyl-CoA thioesterase PaaI [Saccharopolyspora sp. HNM0983]|uniref:Hydroxyphenylacetyl-CoA thioesterase PaaI n=1 Tax=Saccharopolyspora montiporae TaxID=2781240 RepID=A0A929BAJ8_9PSEU|nr:hydroxyphenylacetyl-CoA thioesterase PaaI [Saccharopolyspora sp. HNM0983]MBE9376309.1 hydroxyphenylacetyl-CoA thioesterase PaaI [Saccharopolyspora sp. HNM0983]